MALAARRALTVSLARTSKTTCRKVDHKIPVFRRPESSVSRWVKSSTDWMDVVDASDPYTTEGSSARVSE
jgi:hypothetical protein